MRTRVKIRPLASQAAKIPIKKPSSYPETPYPPKIIKNPRNKKAKHKEIFKVANQSINHIQKKTKGIK